VREFLSLSLSLCLLHNINVRIALTINEPTPAPSFVSLETFVNLDFSLRSLTKSDEDENLRHSDMKNRPPIKNNLNEQLKIYYAYRDEATRARSDDVENRPVPQ
jgi:hypothetical protein